MLIKNLMIHEGIRDARAWLFDLDGTLYFGAEAAPGAREVLALIRSLGHRVAFITNNSRHSAKEIAQRLQLMGLEAAEQAIVTATEYTARYLKEQYGSLAVGVAGSRSFVEAHRLAGHSVHPLGESSHLDAVVIGLDTAFTYRQLELLVFAIGRGAKLIAANADVYHPGEGGRRVPETGSLVSAVEAAAGLDAVYIGKPEPHLFRYALSLCESSVSQTIMVGDNYNTDITGGKQVGLRTVWLSGSAAAFGKQAPALDPHAADVIVRHLPELYIHLGGQTNGN